MPVPITQKQLVDWAGPQIFQDAEMLVENGRVLEAEYKHPVLSGAILWNNRPFKTNLEIRDDGFVESGCPCRDNRERGIICAHIIAVGIVVIRRSVDPHREAKYQAEARRAERVAAVDESEYITRVASDSPGAIRASVRVTLASGWKDGLREGNVPVICEAEYGKQVKKLDEVPRDVPLTFSKRDESLLFVLEDISEGPAQGEISMSLFDFVNIIRLHSGRRILQEDGDPIFVNEAAMTTVVKMDLDPASGELILTAHTELPFVREGDRVAYAVSGRTGWVYGADNCWPLENVLPTPYHGIYEGQVVVARRDVLRFLRQELDPLSEQAAIHSDISPDLFTVEPARPFFKLCVKGSQVSLAATLLAVYDDMELVAGKPDSREKFGIPDSGDLMRYTVRNEPAEKRALEILADTGFTGDCGDDLCTMVGSHNVLNFLATHLPTLRRRGWKIDIEGKAAPFVETLRFATPVVHIDDGPSDRGGSSWFDVSFDFDDGADGSLSQADVHRALRKGEYYLERNGKTVLLDADAIDSMQGVFSDCASEEGDAPGHFKMANIYAPFVKSSLDSLDGIDIDVTREWRSRNDRYNRSLKLEPVTIPEPLHSTLRFYQRQGVDWLVFLEKQGFCGILADEMGLGKTVQTLAWLGLERQNGDSHDKPALIVCPTSIVENWAEEAVRFVPDMKVMTLSGADRHERWDDLDDHDIAITSYALLRRDVDRYLEHDFSVLILDEAQHIKNRSTQNAVSAKKIQAHHRLVLTGTPIENGVSDLWSIMDFLMPGYLGSHEAFRQHYELPLSRGGPDAEIAQLRLRRKLHPFLLRRLKVDVAKDLPPKIQKVSTCSLTADQKTVYAELLSSSRKRIADMVDKRGFNRCRMEILTTLMRLRQVCCHLDLLGLEDLKTKEPSAKLALFLELLDEAMDSGHRVLVFSQFVSMLKILREELERRDLRYCYLDGSTKNRMQVVHEFNTERSIPLFLISLKAGGTGLNLTGADMVIHFDPWWNPAVEDQATDRAYRIGQKKTVYSIKLITKGTVEEKVVELQKKKRDIIDATIESDDEVIKSMSWEDVQDLLSL